MARVLVAMSGGVDSSFTAWLLKKKGFDVAGATLDFKKASNGCELKAVGAAKEVEASHVVLNQAVEFEAAVVAKFVEFYETAKTPNPCVWCNKIFKFGKLLNYAKENHFDYLATGHYARIEFSEAKNCFVLKRAVDRRKDQTYFLYFLKQEQLKRILFPLGNLTKAEVKKTAAEIGLKSALEPESQDICFVGDGGYVDFIKKFTKRTYAAGNFVDEKGAVLGRHEGIINYTIGQRKGLKLAFSEPHYVKEIRPDTNEVVLAPRSGLLVKKIVLKDVNLIFFDNLKSSIFVTVKLRYGAFEFKAEVFTLKAGEAVVKLEQAQIAPARGQVVVFYDGELVVGGGTVKGFVE